MRRSVNQLPYQAGRQALAVQKSLFCVQELELSTPHLGLKINTVFLVMFKYHNYLFSSFPDHQCAVDQIIAEPLARRGGGGD